ncbi:MAG: hypothetical protein RR347_09205 [Anaerovoracaceae bacterium]
MVYFNYQISDAEVKAMKKNINIIVANPAGNVTIFVLNKFPRSQYQTVATQLLELEEYAAEQVCFILEMADEKPYGKMEMCGLEFCGNASRSFGLIIAKKLKINGLGQITVSVSGSEELLTVGVDTERNYTKINMPKPLSVETIENTPIAMLNGCKKVDFGGIIHVVLTDVEPSRDNFDIIKDYINKEYDPPAVGAMFYNTSESILVPVVYVKDVNTTYFEGSCGSGTTAVAVAFATDESDGTYSFTLPQPAGTICATVEKSNGNINDVYIQGQVSLSDIISVEIDL